MFFDTDWYETEVIKRAGRNIRFAPRGKKPEIWYKINLAEEDATAELW